VSLIPKLKPRSDDRSADRLYIFVTSALPDPYVNVIVYAIRHFQLGRVYFISVAEHGYPNEDDDESGRLRAVVADVDLMLNELSEGRYISRSKENPDRNSTSIGADAAGIYKSCLARWERIENTSSVIMWDDLDAKLAEFSKDGHAIFDVTALKKNLLVDAVVLLLSRGCNQVFDFEILRRRRYFNERDLIHNLNETDNAKVGDFVYRNLTATSHLRVAQRRMVARSITFRNLILLTAVVGAIVLLVHIFFPSSWAETAVLTAATTAAIVSLLFLLLRD
jgi:hypothetical protein